MKPYSYVAVIGIDGMGNFNWQAETPQLDRIFANGAVTYQALSMDPTISAENWGGMLLGAEPAVHNLTNGYISCHPYWNDALPSLFRRIREAMPEACLASVVNWEPINIGVVEDGIGVDKRTADNDALVTAEILDCIPKKPTFLFVQLDEVDGAGHHFGYGTPGHLEKIREIDALVGQIYDAYVQEGIAEDTLFICLADHGGVNHGHGGWADTEKYIYFAAAGRDVCPGEIAFAETKDISALVLYALGLPVPDYTPGGYTSQVPPGIFADPALTYRLPAPAPHPAQKAAVAYDAPDGLGRLFGERVQLCLQCDDTLTDAAGNCALREHGAVKFYTNGVRGEAAEFGATGALEVEGLRLRPGFSVLFWVLADADLPEQICLLGNKSPARGQHQAKGFNVLLRNHSIMVQYGCGDDDTDTVTAFGADRYSGWIHVALSFDTRSGETVCYLNFQRAHTDRIAPSYAESLPNGGRFVIGDDDCMTFNRSRGLIFRMDDLLILNDTLTDADVAALGRLYE
ncbi:MAG: alkaline phosphatase family protein [Clostridia bacterium]|nr:alkaline phosphatase family protein [Clostridia bacterium]